MSCSLGLPCIVRPAKREGQSRGHSSALDTRWLRGSSRFSKTAAGFLSPPRWWALPCLSSVGPAAILAHWQEGEWALAQGLGSAPGASAPDDQLPGQAWRKPPGAREAAGQGHWRGTVGACDTAEPTVLVVWGVSLLLPLLSSCAPSENPLHKTRSPKHKYCLLFEGFHRSYKPS